RLELKSRRQLHILEGPFTKRIAVIHKLLLAALDDGDGGPEKLAAGTFSAVGIVDFFDGRKEQLGNRVAFQLPLELAEFGQELGARQLRQATGFFIKGIEFVEQLYRIFRAQD